MHVILGVAALFGGVVGLVATADNSSLGPPILIGSAVFFAAACILRGIEDAEVAIVHHLKQRAAASDSATPARPAAAPAKPPAARQATP